MKGLILSLLLAITLTPVTSQNALRFYGLRIFVNSPDTTSRFYQENFGFEIAERTEKEIILETGSWPIYLEKSNDHITSSYPKVSRVGLTMETYKLLPRIDQFRLMGVSLYDSLLQRNGVGISIPFQDPSQNVLSLMEVQIRKVLSFEGLRIYNTGVTVGQMDEAMSFYEDILGLEEWSRKYLPDALPLKHKSGSFAFMIHYKKGLTKNQLAYGISPQMVLILATKNLKSFKKHLIENNITFNSLEDSIVCQDPAGNFIEILESRD